jgi:hypothetical protein
MEIRRIMGLRCGKVGCTGSMVTEQMRSRSSYGGRGKGWKIDMGLNCVYQVYDRHQLAK